MLKKGVPGKRNSPRLPVKITAFSNLRRKEETVMTKYKLEYIWLDGYTPVPSLRGKTQIKEFEAFPTLDQLPLWGFDGSSTNQAEGHSSDCVLKPVAVYPDGARTDGVLVMCEVMMPNGSRTRRTSARLFSTMPARGSASSRNTSFIRTAARLAFRRRLSGAAGPLLHRRRLQECWRHRPQDRRRASRSLPLRRHQP